MFGSLWEWIRGGLKAKNTAQAAARKFPQDAAALRTARNLALGRARPITNRIGAVWRKVMHPPLKMAAPLVRRAGHVRIAFHDHMQKVRRRAEFNVQAGRRTNVLPHAQTLKKPIVKPPPPVKKDFARAAAKPPPPAPRPPAPRPPPAPPRGPVKGK